MAGGYDVRALYPDLFEGIDEDLASQIASGFGSDAHEGYEANRRDVELMLMYATDQITRAEFTTLARVEIGLPPETPDS